MPGAAAFRVTGRIWQLGTVAGLDRPFLRISFYIHALHPSISLMTARKQLPHARSVSFLAGSKGTGLELLPARSEEYRFEGNR